MQHHQSGVNTFLVESPTLSMADSYPVKPEWSGRIALSVEDYLHSLINVINELVGRLSLVVL